ncbi:hypothetical protein RSWS8N_01160 [Cereibacter sphaeroides WS8N]|uniref:Uncharacterized protein n=1 Tax=Cereibacter johrii TaxID=445629 RepID=A0ABX5JCI2_9RHOB|nr:hypothetical protein RSWS8N_01160 [Cereibacter sphaeroides WS8N]PTM81558.1 hypothetical protein C8J29_101500 [Cereibacter johrii]
MIHTPHELMADLPGVTGPNGTLRKTDPHFARLVWNERG